MAIYIKNIFFRDADLYITEIGHSKLSETKTVGPWAREQFILHLVTEGYCDFSGFRACSGQAFLISKGLSHSFTTSRNYEHYWIGFDGSKVPFLFDIFSLSMNQHQLFYVENADFVKSLFLSAIQAFTSTNTDSYDSIAPSILLAALPLLKIKEKSETYKSVNYVEKVQRFIELNYMYPIKMENIAKEIHISSKYMYKLFLAHFGISPQRYLLKTRMEKAKKKLIESNFSVKEIAFSVGYTSVPSFSKVFSNYYGTSPSFFRKIVLGK
ncbi:MAG: AraC family transcriptional regulator [Ruminococcaceae bacterium]|nr:AraC family transcriptional regulator [Oscillospiraceae bacterium]